MATQKQIEANRRNALKSTGPRTAEGKARSRGNGLVHGLSVQPRFPEISDPDFVHQVEAVISSRWPRSPQEAAVAVNLALGDWLRHRETVLSTRCYGAYAGDMESPDPAVRQAAMDDFGVALRALLRLGARADRIYYPASNAWMRILGTDPATIAGWEAEDREDQEDLDEDLEARRIEQPMSPEQARAASQEHERFVQEAVRVHFGPGSLQAWMARREALRAAAAHPVPEEINEPNPIGDLEAAGSGKNHEANPIE